jgi:hypothetical protein
MKARDNRCPSSPARRRAMRSAGVLALVSLVPLRSRASDLPAIPALSGWLA